MLDELLNLSVILGVKPEDDGEVSTSHQAECCAIQTKLALSKPFSPVDDSCPSPKTGTTHDIFPQRRAC